MEKFVRHTGTAVPLRRADVDTDQIIPAEYLKRITRSGFADALFAAWRNDKDFVLNNPRYDNATILIAGKNFGTGSSREHAVWALQNYGFRVVISSRFADIFRGNSLKSGLFTVEIPHDAVEVIQSVVDGDPETAITVDLEAREILFLQEKIPFELDNYVRWRFMEGLDDIDLTLRHSLLVNAFEETRSPYLPATL